MLDIVSNMSVELIRGRVTVAGFLADPRPPQIGMMWLLGGVVLIVMVLGGTYLFSYLLRRLLGDKPAPAEDLFSAKPSTDNPTAFMTASMQAVIQRLRDQEKELAALHRRDRERDGPCSYACSGRVACMAYSHSRLIFGSGRSGRVASSPRTRSELPGGGPQCHTNRTLAGSVDHENRPTYNFYITAIAAIRGYAL